LSTSTSSCSLLMMFVFCCVAFDTAGVSGPERAVWRRSARAPSSSCRRCNVR
jgi:hypothetical protein